MAEVTVKQLALAVGVPVERLLRQMRDASLPQRSENDSVSDEDKRALLAYSKRGKEPAPSAPRRIALKRTSRSMLRSGQGRSGSTVSVQRKRRRIYVKGGEAAKPPVVAKPAAEAKPSQVEVEAERIRQQELERKAAEEKIRENAARQQREKEEQERQRQEQLARLEEEAKRAAEAARAAESAKSTAPAESARTQERVGKRVKDRIDRSRERGRARDDDFGDGRSRRRELSLKRQARPPRRRVMPTSITVETKGGEFTRPQDAIQHEVELPEFISVGELAQRMSVKASEVIKTLMDMGVMATINQPLDQETAALVVEEMGHNVKLVATDEIEQEHKETLTIDGESEPRSSVVTVMGHVDHGKTSLLDYIRNTRVVAGEAGGITQHIGAYRVTTEFGDISFLDTPGHAAFAAMRARGARATDIVVLVVAGDDGVMPQTEEAVQHAKASEVPIIVAINKMDLEGADPDRIKNELSALDVIPEDWGGDTQFVEVSAETGDGIDRLLEAINLQAEILELKAVPDAPGQGVVVESRLDRGRGPVATLLVQNGTLRRGDIVIAGEHFGRVRLMMNERGERVEEAGPSVPVEILGLNATPEAGDDFSVVADERRARELAEFRADQSQAQRNVKQAANIESIFADLAQGEKRVMKIVLKADVRGSLEAISQACGNLGNDEVAVNIVWAGVGGISESDAMLALTSDAAIFGFNVRADNNAKAVIEREGIDLHYYSVIYELLDDIKGILEGLLAPEIREEIVGMAEVRDVFPAPRFGQVAGCMVVDGTVGRNKQIRVLRDNVVIFEGELESLRRFKDDVAEVRSGLECGIGVRNYNDVRIGDKIEVFESGEVARTL